MSFTIRFTCDLWALPDPATAFFTAAEGWGLFTQKLRPKLLAADIALRYGRLPVREIVLQSSGGGVTKEDCAVTIDGLDAIRRIVAEAPDVLAGGGALIMEFGHTQADAVRDLLAASETFAEPKILRDHQNIERTAVAVRR